MSMKKISIIVLVVAVVVLAGIVVWQNWIKPAPAVNNQPNINEPVTNQQNNQTKLTLNILNNAEYYSGSMLPGERIKLTNGTYQAKAPLEWTTKLETVTYGDLNNDGQEDAVVVLSTRAGGTGVFGDLEAVLNQSGKAFNIAIQDLGDRTTVNSIKIESGVIIVDMSPKGDPRKVVQYKLSGDKLQEVN